jgi:hypothetical protein
MLVQCAAPMNNYFLCATRQTMGLLCIALALTASIPNCSDEATRHLAERSTLIVVAKVTEVGPSSGIWSGQFAVRQRVDYEILEVLKGSVRMSKIRVSHPIVAGSSSADPKQARLSPVLFAKGTTFLLFLVPDYGKQYVIPPEPNDEGLTKFFDLDENCGARLASGESFDHIKAIVQDSAALKGRER